VCGARVLEGKRLRAFRDNLAFHLSNCCRHNIMMILHSGISVWDVIIRLYSANIFTDHNDFIAFMMMVKSRQCLDPRDKVYGVLSLADEKLRARMPPYYNLSTAEVYSKLTSTSIKITQSLDILSCVAGERRKHLQLPSFVLDWSSPLEDLWLTTCARRVETFTDRFYGASRNSKPPLDLLASVTRITGCVLIDAVRTVHDVDGYDVMDEGVQKQYLDGYYRTAEDDGPKAPYLSKAVAFWRSMCGSLAYNGYSVRPARSSDYAAFVQWRMQMDDTLGTLESYEKVNSFWTLHNVVSIGRRFFITEQGYIRWGPTGITKGDHVAILSGGRVPYVLRRVSGKPETKSEHHEESVEHESMRYFQFLGDAYVQGIMNEEKYDETKLEKIALI
jgi:hypothetical protein